MAPTPKNVVSTSGIYKSHRNRKALDKPAVKKPRYNRKEPESEHVLAQQFSRWCSQSRLRIAVSPLTIVAESIEHSREIILEEGLGLIRSAHGGLIDEIAASESSLQSKKEQHSGLREILSRPLSEEILVFEEDKRRYKVTLGERMNYFGNKRIEIEQRLNRLWKEWEEVQDQILSLGEEVLGPQGIEVGGSTAAQPLHEEYEKLTQNLAMGKASLGKDIEVFCQDAIQRMKDSENVVSAILTGMSNTNNCSEIEHCHEKEERGYCAEATDGHLRLYQWCYIAALFAILSLDLCPQFSSCHDSALRVPYALILLFFCYLLI